jgi:glycosyltransferase involved in cell wall biosynthesis
VATELNQLFRNGGIGTHNSLLAETLAAAGWNVHVLYCSDVENSDQLTRCRNSWAEQGITLHHLSEFDSPAVDRAACGLIGPLDTHSLHIRRALEQLDSQHRFELIEFAEWTGYGFRTIQAHVMGAVLPDCRIAVRLHSSSQWCREGNRQWLAGSDDLMRDYFERYSFEHADYQLSPTRYMLDFASRIGWNVRADARVIPYCFPAAATKASESPAGTPELVFFGRLEKRKGLTLFLEAARSLPAEVPVTFLGKETPIDGVPARELIARTLAGRQFTVHTQLDRGEAIEYLCQAHRVAIMPSLIENYPFTVLECAAHGIPFLASNVGGIPEIVSDRDLQDVLLFEPTARSLRQKLDAFLVADQAKRRRWVQRMQEICNATNNHAEVCQAYAELLPLSTRSSAICSLRVVSRNGERDVVKVLEPLVSVVVPYYNMGVYLPETLASLAAQDYQRTEVIVVNDGSTDRFALHMWEQMQNVYPQFRYISQANQGLGAARNAGLNVARGEFFIPVDADNIARSDMVSQLVQALVRNPDVSVATCYFLAFEETDDIEAGEFLYAYRPCGGPFVAAALRNVYGDANAMSRSAVLRAHGGYETDKDTTCEDWEMYVKLARQGHRIDVVPEYLFYYRHRATSLLRTTDAFLNRRRVLRQFFSVADMPLAEQVELWTALASFDKGPQWLVPQHAAVPVKKRKGLRRAVYKVKQVLRRAPYYSTISGTLKQFRKRAA